MRLGRFIDTRHALSMPFQALIIAMAFLVAPIFAARSADTLAADTKYFYKQPSVSHAHQILDAINKSPNGEKANAQPPIAGFFAAIFLKYPADIDKIVPTDLTAPLRSTIAVALHMANQDKRASVAIDQLRQEGNIAPDLDKFPWTLASLPARGPSEFDILWGASFATGDPQYCRRILDRYAELANVGDNAKDMVVIVKAAYVKEEDRRDVRWVVDKYGKEKAYELIVVSSALWALTSNSLQHDFVRDVVGSYIKTHPETPASKSFVDVLSSPNPTP